MKGFVAAVSIIAQLVGFVAIFWILFEFFTLPDELRQQFFASTETTRRYVVETVDSWQPWPAVGLVGVIVGWLLIMKAWCRDPWFLATSRVLAWIWLVIFPIGTVMGALVLSARARAIRDLKEPK